ncbi:MAG: aryl-alcohol dehydrogenase-like predicted oxidoreductase [Paracoccaceae bacterium]|jgi:aryl-alcohol dehydrogenase-like predicted oxidoreductase
MCFALAVFELPPDNLYLKKQKRYLMQTHALGHSDLSVTPLCLGSMTWGTQTAEADAHAQLDRALEGGINFVDTAEMYPVNPIHADTVGKTEQIIGNWIKATGKRDQYIIATKISGRNESFVRPGQNIDAKTLCEAIEGSLRRLQTDMIDLYQLHWPNRGSYHFRQNWTFDPSGQSRENTQDNMIEVLETLKKLQVAGKIRHVGLSNESAWGTAEWLRLARMTGTPEVVSIQNEYSVLCRLYDTDLAELSVNENIGLLAFSPLAAGLLTGKYRDGALPEGSRRELNGTLGGRWTDRVGPAVEAYAQIALKHGLDLTHMTLAWCQTRPFMGSAIFGATTLEQLDHILKGADLVLSREVIDEIDAAHRVHPMPY